jgi:hypothetical protein
VRHRFALVAPFVELTTDNNPLQRGLNQGANLVRQFGRTISIIGRGVLTAGAALSAPFAASLKVFSEAGKDIQAFRQQAALVHIKIPTADLNAARVFAKAIQTLTIQAKVLALTVGAALAPALQKTVTWLTKGTATATSWVRQHHGLVEIAAKGATALSALGVAIVAIGRLSMVTSAIMKLMSFSISAIGRAASLVMSPWGLLIAAIVAGGAAFLTLTDTGRGLLGGFVSWLGDTFGSVVPIAQTTWRGVTDALQAGDLGLAAQIALAGVKAAFLANTKELQRAWIEFSSFMERDWQDIVGAITGGWWVIRGSGKDTLTFRSIIWPAMVEGAGMWWTAIKEASAEAWSGMVKAGQAAGEGIGAVWSWISDQASSAWTQILDYFKPVLETLQSWWQKFTQWFVSTFGDAIGQVRDAMQPLLATAALVGITAAAPALNTAKEVQQFGKEFADTKKAVDDLQAALQRKADLEAPQRNRQFDEDHQRRLRDVDDAANRAAQQLADLAAQAGAAKDRAAQSIGDPGQLLEKADVHGTFSGFAAVALGSDKLNQLNETAAGMLQEQKKTNQKFDDLNNGFKLK